MLVSAFLVSVKLMIFPHLVSAYDSTVKKVQLYSISFHLCFLSLALFFSSEISILSFCRFFVKPVVFPYLEAMPKSNPSSPHLRICVRQHGNVCISHKCVFPFSFLDLILQNKYTKYHRDILSVPKFTANLYRICLSIDLRYA